MTSAQIKNSFTHLGEIDSSVSPSSLTLKLMAAPHALRYFVLSQTHQQVIFFGDYTLHHIGNETALANAIEKIFEKDEVLQLPFAKVLVGLDEKYELVPHELVGLVAGEETSVTSYAGTDIVFETAAERQNLFKRLFTNPEFVHLNSTFLRLLPAYVKDAPQSFFVNVSKEYLDAILFRDEQLQLMNSRPWIVHFASVMSALPTILYSPQR